MVGGKTAIFGLLILAQAGRVHLTFPTASHSHTAARSHGGVNAVDVPQLARSVVALRGGSAVMLTVIDQRGSSCPVQVHNSLTIAELKGLLEPEFDIPATEQEIHFQGCSLSDNATLANCSITDNSLVAVSRKSRVEVSPQSTHQTGQLDLSQLQEAFRQAGVTPSQQQHDLRVSRPQTMVDPLDERMQASIEQQIRRTNVDENFKQALEHNPEAFGKVPLLRIRFEINRKEVVGIVDTGAEATIMSRACAERLGLMRLVDERFRGTALGVGSSRIIGRVHVVPLKVGESFLSVALTVLEGGSESLFLFGLDNLRRHQCCVDLKHFQLVLGGTEEAVPFLSEGDGGEAGALAAERAEAEAAATVGHEEAGRDQRSDVDGGRAAAHGAGQQEHGGAGSGSGEGGRWEEQAVRLEGMGFGIAEARAALEASQGSEDLAIELLTTSR